MNKYRKWAVAFCGLSAASAAFSLAVRTSGPGALTIGWLLGMLFIVLAAIMILISGHQK